MPAGPFRLRLRALSFMPTGHLLLLLFYMLYCRFAHMLSCFPKIQLDILVPSKIPLILDMSSNPRLGSLSAPPFLLPQLVLSIAPAPEVPVIALPAPQAVVVEEALPGSLDSSFRYWLEAEEIPEVNAVIAVDACTQYSRPGSAAASPCPLVGVRIEAIITSAKPVFQAARHLPPPQSPPPLPPVYQDSTPCVRRRPPQSLIIRRPHTRSSPTDKPLLEPLLSDRY